MQFRIFSNVGKLAGRHHTSNILQHMLDGNYCKLCSWGRAHGYHSFFLACEGDFYPLQRSFKVGVKGI